MISMMIWVIALAGSIGAVCLTVALDAHSAHLGATALVSFGIVAAAVHEHRSAELAGASATSKAAISTRYLGLLWAWSAISAYVVYAFLLDWNYWMPVIVSMFLACGLCLFVAWILDRDGAADASLGSSALLVMLITRGQFALGGLLLGFAISACGKPELGGMHRWVALNLVMCTAAALLTLTGYLIISETTATSRTTPAAAGDTAVA